MTHKESNTEAYRRISELIAEDYWDSRPDDSVKDRIRLLRSSKKTRLVIRRTKKKKGEPVPSKDDHDEAQEADSLELDDLSQLLRDRLLGRKRG